MQRVVSAFKICILFVVTVSLILFMASCGDDYNAEYERKLEELIYRKQQLTAERESLDPDMEEALGNASYMSFVFVGLDSALYTDVYPIMSEGEIKLVGVMAFSKDELPGMEGKITVEQYGELIISGWGTALYWNGDGNLEEFISEMRILLGDSGIDLPKSIIFAENSYTQTYDQFLADYGIENAVHSGEEDLHYIDKSEPVGVWHPGRIGWRWIGKSTSLKKNVEADNGYALFEVGFDNSEESSRTSFFPIEGDSGDGNRVTVFTNMINTFKASIASGKIEVYNIDDTRDRVENYYTLRKEIETKNAIRREQIDAQLDEISRSITELYNEYH